MMEVGSLVLWCAIAASAIALTALLAADLRQKGFEISTALSLGGLAVAQPAYVTGPNPLHGLLAGLATCAVGLCAIALVEEQSARRIVLMGGSLAGAQLVDSADGMAAALALPLLLRLPHGRAELERTLGLYMLLLFLPAVILIGRLYYFAGLGNDAIARWPGDPVRADSDRAVLAAVASLIVFLPALLQTLATTQSRAASTILSLAAATLFAALISAPAAAISAVAAILPPLAVLLIGQWSPSARRSRLAVVLLGAGTAAAWIYDIATRALAHV